jgi:ATP-dependent DNA ligase
VRFHRAPLWTKSAVRAICPRDDTSANTVDHSDLAEGKPFDDPDWLFDFKYDGFGGLSYIEQGRCRFISRNGNVLNRFEALADQLAGHARR